MLPQQNDSESGSSVYIDIISVGVVCTHACSTCTLDLMTTLNNTTGISQGILVHPSPVLDTAWEITAWEITALHWTHPGRSQPNTRHSCVPARPISSQTWTLLFHPAIVAGAMRPLQIPDSPHSQCRGCLSGS